MTYLLNFYFLKSSRYNVTQLLQLVMLSVDSRKLPFALVVFKLNKNFIKIHDAEEEKRQMQYIYLFICMLHSQTSSCSVHSLYRRMIMASKFVWFTKKGNKANSSNWMLYSIWIKVCGVFFFLKADGWKLLYPYGNLRNFKRFLINSFFF